MFDLDETLIHCNESTSMPSDVILPIVFPTGDVVEVKKKKKFNYNIIFSFLLPLKTSNK